MCCKRKLREIFCNVFKGQNLQDLISIFSLKKESKIKSIPLITAQAQSKRKAVHGPCAMNFLHGSKSGTAQHEPPRQHPAISRSSQ
jgi:hypothetical protein